MKAESINIADRIVAELKIAHQTPVPKAKDKVIAYDASETPCSTLDTLDNHFDFQFLQDLRDKKHLTAF